MGVEPFQKIIKELIDLVLINKKASKNLEAFFYSNSAFKKPPEEILL